MHRIDTDGAVSSLFNEGDPAVPRNPTQVDKHWLNAVQEEIVNAVTVVNSASVSRTLTKGTNNQLASAMTRNVQIKTEMIPGNGFGTPDFYPDALLITGTNANGLVLNPPVHSTSGSPSAGNDNTRAPLRFVPCPTPTYASEGDVYYDSTTHKLRVYTGSAWVDLH